MIPKCQPVYEDTRLIISIDEYTKTLLLNKSTGLDKRVL